MFITGKINVPKMDVSVLEKMGLTQGESKIYLALLGLGQSTTGPIVEKSGVSTSKTYKILKRLENKGLASHITKKNVTHWSAANPKRILELLEEKEKEIYEKKKEVERILPKLMKQVELVKEKQKVEVYIGMKGMITIFNEETDYLAEHPESTEYVIGIVSIYKKAYMDFFERIEIRRNKLKIKRKMLFGLKAKGSQPWVEKAKYCEVRYIDYPDSPISINIYGDTSFICMLSEEPLFVVIKSKEIAESFMHYFKILWRIAKK